MTGIDFTDEHSVVKELYRLWVQMHGRGSNYPYELFYKYSWDSQEVYLTLQEQGISNELLVTAATRYANLIALPIGREMGCRWWKSPVMYLSEFCKPEHIRRWLTSTEIQGGTWTPDYGKAREQSKVWV